MSIDELIERVRGLTGPSDFVDAELYATLDGAPHTTTSGSRIIPLIEKGDPNIWPAYTARLDAAVALGERLLPGQAHSLFKTALEMWSDKADSFARHYVLVLLSALKAKEAREDE